MDKNDVNSLVFMRLEYLKSELSRCVDSIFDHCDNPVLRSTLVCSLISDLEFHCVDLLKRRNVYEDKKVRS